MFTINLITIICVEREREREREGGRGGLCVFGENSREAKGIDIEIKTHTSEGVCQRC